MHVEQQHRCGQWHGSWICLYSFELFDRCLISPIMESSWELSVMAWEIWKHSSVFSSYVFGLRQEGASTCLWIRSFLFFLVSLLRLCSVRYVAISWCDQSTDRHRHSVRIDGPKGIIVTLLLPCLEMRLVDLTNRVTTGPTISMIFL